MSERRELRATDGVRLSCRDFGGDGPGVLLLHGLAGHAEEWASTADWLTGRAHVVAPDARGQGRSERRPRDVSRDALIADAALVIEALDLAPAVIVGQSIGGLTALSLADRRPDLARALVVVEAGPSGGEEQAEAAASQIRDALGNWPVPFGSYAEAERFFTERYGFAQAGRVWASGLEDRGDGLWPRFEVDVMAAMLRAGLTRSSWEEWERIACPALVVRGGGGSLDSAEAQEMARRTPRARLVVVAGAGHDLHLDSPDEWRDALSGFLDALPADPA